MEPTSSQAPADSGEVKPVAVVLPRQLEGVPRASEFPTDRHRWNTNEEVAAILIAFDHHSEWQSKDVKLRPPSGSMLLYNRKKVRYRKDGYCWKKRKDGKTTREDHMKLKVQGMECIYGCYVHSAILPTFHRRCYWLLHNPDIVLVHYLNVPLTDDNKMALPTLSHCTEKKEWSKDELIGQLRPMFASMGHNGGTNPAFKVPFLHQMEETLQSIVEQLLESQQKQTASSDCNCTAGGTCDKPSCRNKCHIISPKAVTSQASSVAQSSPRLVSVLQGQRSAPMPPSHDPRVVSTAGGTSLIINSSQPSVRAAAPQAPLILNLSQLQASNGLIILSSQTPAPISILNSGSTSTTSQASNVRNIPAGNVSIAPLQQAETMDQYEVNSGAVIGPSTGGADLRAASLEQGQSRETGDVAHVSIGSQSSSFAHPAVGQYVQVQHGHFDDNVITISPVKEEGDVVEKLSSMVVDRMDAAQSQTQAMEHSQPSTPESVHNQVVTTPSHHSILTTPHTTAVPGPIHCSRMQPNAPNTHIPQPGRHNHVHPQTQTNLHPPSRHQHQSQAQLRETNMEQGSLPCPHNYPPNTSSLQNKNTTAQDIVSELNLKNELSTFADSLQLTHEEIQQTLSANLLNGPRLTQSVVESGNDTMSTVENMDSARAGMVSPSGADLNLDAFDILDWDFDRENLPSESDIVVTSQSCENMASTATSSTVSMVTATTTSTTTTTLGCSNCLNSQKMQEEPKESRAGIANITDFSPDWSYPEGGVKVLVTGPWYSTTSPYSVLFDGQTVPATLVQSGVLRCFCPAHGPGLVTLQVACEGYIISNSCVFEYKAKQAATEAERQKEWFQVQEDQLKMAVLEKLEDIEKRLAPAGPGLCPHTKSQDSIGNSVSSFESRLIQYVARLTCRCWVKGNDLIRASSSRLTLLHLVAALGYTHLIVELIRWRMENPSLVLEYEVDALSIDDRACTPLMWASIRGHLDTVAVLCHWNSSALNVCNKDGALPVTLARSAGHVHITQFICKLEACRQGAPLLTKISHQPAAATTATGLCMSPPEMHAHRNDIMTLGRSAHDANASLAWDSMEALKVEIPPSPPYSKSAANTIPSSWHKSGSSTSSRMARLAKRISIEVLPDYPTPGLSGNANPQNSGSSHLEVQARSLRTVNSDPHIVGLAGMVWDHGNPMISVNNRDLNSPLMFMDTQPAYQGGLTLEDIQRGTVDMETDSPRSRSPYVDKFSDDDSMRRSPESAIDEACSEDSQNQMVTLANQIIAAMPERIKSSPSRGDDLLLEDDIILAAQRERSSSHSSFSSYAGSSSTTPPGTEDSGISTPLEGLAYEEYRYPDLGTPASSLSPASSCLQSPYNFSLDSPPPTTAEFTEYFNAPTIFMEKDFSLLTLSDVEQRRLYEAAKIIQSFYRQYKDKKAAAQQQHQQQHQQQSQRQIQAAILIQSYYRRYKQYEYYKKMTQAAVLIQSQFRSYYAQKRFKRSREAATVIQNQYRTYKEHERFKRSRNAAVIIQQRFRSHYQRKRSQQERARKMQQAVKQSTQSSEADDTVTEEIAPHSTDKETIVGKDGTGSVSVKVKCKNRDHSPKHGSTQEAKPIKTAAQTSQD